MRVDISFLPALAAAFLLTFARVGAMVMLLPGVGELSLPSRVRLTIALVLTAILLPAHQKAYVVDLKALGPVLVLLFQELVIGAVLGLTARLALSALQITGSVVAQQLGLGFVTPSIRRKIVAPPGSIFCPCGVALCLQPICITVIAAMNDIRSARRASCHS